MLHVRALPVVLVNFAFLLCVRGAVSACEFTTTTDFCSTDGQVRKCIFYQNIAGSDGLCTFSTTPCDSGQYMYRTDTVDGNGNLVRPKICRSYTDCTADEFQLIDGRLTEERDNVCVSLTVCSDNEWQSQAPTSTADRVCSPLTECTSNQYISVNFTESSDRVCIERTACLDGQYNAAPDDPTQDNDCRNYTQCNAGYGVILLGSQTSDLQCGLCEPGEFGVGDSEPCQPCPSSHFSWAGQASCTPHTVCANVYAFLGNSTDDAECMESCPDTWELNQVTKLCSKCKEGYYINEAGDCAPCPANHYCPVGSWEKVPCTSVTSYTAVDTGEIFVVPYSPEMSHSHGNCSCLYPGFDGVAEALEGCFRCPERTYSDGTVQGCSDCPLNFYVETRELVSSGNLVNVNVGCLSCPADKPYTHAPAHDVSECLHYGYCLEDFYWDADTRSCQACSLCEQGRVLSNCTNEADTECGPCTAISWDREPCAYGSRMPACNEDSCVPCEEPLPSNAAWYDECKWKCNPGFYEDLTSLFGACLPCSEECTRAGLTRIPCSGSTDAACGAPCKNMSKPILWSTWVSTQESTCEWECVPGRRLVMSDTGFYHCVL